MASQSAFYYLAVVVIAVVALGFLWYAINYLIDSNKPSVAGLAFIPKLPKKNIARRKGFTITPEIALFILVAVISILVVVPLIFGNRGNVFALIGTSFFSLFS